MSMPPEQPVRPGTSDGPATETGPGHLGFRATLAAPGFRRLLVAQTVSSLGDWVATLAFIVAAFALTQNQTAVAIVLILRLVPPLFAAAKSRTSACAVDARDASTRSG